MSRLSPRWWFPRLALVAASVGAALLLFEGGLRLAGYGAIYDVYSKPSLFWQHDPLLGWSHQPGATGVYRGPRPYPIEFETEVRINALGLRGPELTPLPPGGLRMLVLGDSSVAAFEVAHEETFVAVAERELTRRLGRPVQAVNAGVRGYGTDQALLYYRERGRALSPDLVVHVHSNNDVTDNVTLHRMRRVFGKAAYALREGGALEEVGTPIPRYPTCTHHALDAGFAPTRLDSAFTRSVCRLQVGLFDRSALFTFVSLRVARSRALTRWLYQLGSPDPAAAYLPSPASARLAGFGVLPSPAKAQEAVRRGARTGRPHQYALARALLIELSREVRRDGALFLLYVGSDERGRLGAEALEAAGVEVLEPLPLGRLVDPARYRFRNDFHFNALGHQRFARPLVDRVEALASSLERAPSPPREESVRP